MNQDRNSLQYDAILQAEQYINNMDPSSDFTPTGITKDYYLDMMELSIKAYSKEELELRVEEQEHKQIVDIQAFSRITSAIGILISQGYIEDYRMLWEKMMDQCCRDIGKDNYGSMADFSMKEIMLVYKVMQDKVSPEKKNYWADQIKCFDPYTSYQETIQKTKIPKLHNILIYNLAGEYLRETEGFVDTTDYYDAHWPTQLDRFDENGMYVDPGAPMLYDLSARVQMQLILGHGYSGKFAKQLDGYQEKAGLMTLFMQSPCYELPYGGRSNQYLFNEALIAANCEYEASRYKKQGDIKKAGIFKRSAHLAVKSIQRWLNENPPKHIKNFYPTDTKFGTENYGYYDKYMVTMGTFVYIAYLFSDDTIQEYPCPAEVGGYFFKTSTAFHKVFANCKYHGIEIDYKADHKYDSTGIGRYHKAGAPSELALSIPFSENPVYELAEDVVKKGVSICPGWEDGRGTIQYLSKLSNGLSCKILVISQNKEEVVFSMEYTDQGMTGCKAVIETYTVNQEGITIDATLSAPVGDRIYYQIPLLFTNGKDMTSLSSTADYAVLSLGNNSYHIKTDGIISIDTTRYGNRNGEYNLARIQKDGNAVKVQLQLK